MNLRLSVSATLVLLGQLAYVTDSTSLPTSTLTLAATEATTTTTAPSAAAKVSAAAAKVSAAAKKVSSVAKKTTPAGAITSSKTTPAGVMTSNKTPATAKKTSIRECYTCDDDTCNDESAGTKISCSGICWAYLHISGTEERAIKGCDLDVTSFLKTMKLTCSSDKKQGEVCEEVDSDKHCMRCCEDSDGCNKWQLTGLKGDGSGASSAALMSLWLMIVGIAGLTSA